MDSQTTSSLSGTDQTNRKSSGKMGDVTTVVESSDPIQTQRSEEITQFIDDAGLQTTSLPSPITPGADVLSGAVETNKHDILSVLQRPVTVSTITWADTAAAESTLVELSFPDALFASSPNLLDKINYFTFLRAGVELEFTVNANSFQQGRIICLFSPYSAEADIGDRTTSNEYLQAYTAFPHCVVSANSGISGKIIIPFASYYTHYNLPLARGTLGTARIVVLNPLKSGNCNITTFARLVNISLEIPTARGLPESIHLDSILDKLSQLEGESAVRKFIERRYKKITAEAQVSEAETKATKGVISSTLDTVAGMSSMATSLPIIGKYALPLSWLARAAGGVAAYFGLSRPIELTPPRRVLELPAYGYTNMDGVDTSVVLGASCENSIGLRNDVFGSGCDEMDIAYVAKHSCYLTTSPWATGDATGANIHQIVVSPGACATDDTNLYRSTTLSYVASCFRFWRGSIKFTIQVTKTAYHSGRLRIGFVPGGQPGNAYDLNQCYNQVLDLRTSDEISFEVPFTSEALWRSSVITGLAGESIELPTNAVIDGAATGVLLVEVLNALRAPDTVEPSVDVNIWMGGGDDIAFSVPLFTRYVPVLAAPTAEAQVLGSFQTPGFNKQIDKAGQMFYDKPAANLDAEATSQGEHVQNFREIIRRFGRIGSGTVDAAAGAYVQLTSNYFGSALDPTQETAVNNIPVCPLYYISWLYRFFRGSVRYKTQCTASEGLVDVFSVPGDIATPVAPSLPTSNATLYRYKLGGGTFEHSQDLKYNKIMEWNNPFYNQTHISLVRGGSLNLLVDNAGDTSTTTFALVRGNYDIKCAAGDDFQFGWMVGPPRIALREEQDELPAVPVNYTDCIGVFKGPGTTVHTTLSQTIPFGVYGIAEVAGKSFSFNIQLVGGALVPCTIPATTTVSSAVDGITEVYAVAAFNFETDIDQTPTIAAVQALLDQQYILAQNIN